MKKFYTLAVVSLVSSLVFIAPVSAHSPYHSDQKMGHGMMRQGMMHGSHMRHGQMHSMTLGQLAYLKAELKITAAQAEVWNGYAEAAKERTNAFEEMHRNMMDPAEDSDAVSRMNDHISAMEAMLAGYKAMKPAMEALYSALNDAQKKIADQLMTKGMGCGAM